MKRRFRKPAPGMRGAEEAEAQHRRWRAGPRWRVPEPSPGGAGRGGAPSAEADIGVLARGRAACGPFAPFPPLFRPPNPQEADGEAGGQGTTWKGSGSVRPRGWEVEVRMVSLTLRGVFLWIAGTRPATVPGISGTPGRIKNPFPRFPARAAETGEIQQGDRAPGVRTAAKDAVATQRGRGFPRGPVVPAHSPASAFVPRECPGERQPLPQPSAQESPVPACPGSLKPESPPARSAENRGGYKTPGSASELSWNIERFSCAARRAGAV